jgi:cysteine synthase
MKRLEDERAALPGVAQSVLELIGRTPMLRLRRFSPQGGATIYAKLEFLNPGGSVKDRAALGMIDAAEAAGLLGRRRR